MGGNPRRCRSMDFAGDHVHAHAVEPAHGPREIAVDDLRAQPDGLENLCPAVALHRGNAHLRRHLDDPLVGRLDVIFLGLIERQILGQQPRLVQIGDGFKRQIRIHRPRPVTDEQTKMMHFPRFPGLDHQPALRARTPANEVVVQPRRRQQAAESAPAWDRCHDPTKPKCSPRRLIAWSAAANSSSSAFSSP